MLLAKHRELVVAPTCADLLAARELSRAASFRTVKRLAHEAAWKLFAATNYLDLGIQIVTVRSELA